jgi:hypothetical protein
MKPSKPEYTRELIEFLHGLECTVNLGGRDVLQL